MHRLPTHLYRQLFVALQLWFSTVVASTPGTNVVVDFVSTKNNGFHLSADDVTTLNEQNVYRYQDVEGDSGVGIAIQNIQAPPETVWRTLLDFEHYPGRIPKVTGMNSYPSTVGVGATDSANVMFHRMTVVFRMMYSFSFHIKHEVLPDKRQLSWTLDPSKDDSRLSESSGYWQVHAHPSRPEWSQVIYSTQMTMGKGIPQFIRKFIRKQGLQKATEWLKTYSEAAYRNEPTTNNEDLVHHPKSLTSEESEVHIVETTGSESQLPPPPPIGNSRYLLVSAVWALVVFNIYLYFSLYR
jgi:Polyketide cyclase / dehydrase and lipid transport